MRRTNYNINGPIGPTKNVAALFCLWNGGLFAQKFHFSGMSKHECEYYGMLNIGLSCGACKMECQRAKGKTAQAKFFRVCVCVCVLFRSKRFEIY